MVNQDSSQYTLRYNEVSSKLEAALGNYWVPVVLTNSLILNATALATTGTITPDATLGPTYTIGVTGNITLNGPSSPVNGQRVIFRITNDASHSVTLATGAGNFRFGTGITAYTNSVSLEDYIGAIYNSTANRWDVVALIQGF